MRVKIPAKFVGLGQPSRYKVFYGGRGGAKSRSFATVLVLRAADETLRILCCREIQSSIDDSVKKVLEDEIERLGLGYKFHITNKSIVCKTTGSEFIFKGLFGNINSIKSIEGVDICWVEEAHTISQHSWDVLEPTIRKENSEIWLSYNPNFKSDPIHRTFVVNEPPPGSLVVMVNYEDNPWFPDVLRVKMEWDKKTDYNKYLHIWRGECVQFSDEQVFNGCWEIGDVPDPPEGTRLHYGLDFGFSTDPAAAVRSWIDDENKRLYIDYESFGHGVETNEYGELLELVPGAINWPIVADSSRPETISYINKNTGYRVVGAKKGKGSIEDGLSYLKGFTIIVDPRCKMMIEEFTKYSYKKDKHTDEILPIIVDAFNHGIDALRYAHEDKIMTDGFVSESILDQVMGRHLEPKHYEMFPKVIGVFCGSTTIITIRQGPLVFPQEEVEDDVMEIVTELSVIIEENDPRTTFIDTTTPTGLAVYQRMSALNYKVFTVNPERKKAKESKYYDKHSEMWYRMKEWLPESALPRSRNLHIDLSAPVATTKNGKHCVESIRSVTDRTGGNFIRGMAQSLAVTFAYTVSVDDPDVHLTQAQRDRKKVMGLLNEGGNAEEW